MQTITMPMLGNTMETGLLVDWEVDVDEDVTEGDVLAIIESEKTTSEVTARQSGRLARVDVNPGEEVPPGTVIGVVLDSNESLDDAPAPRSQLGNGDDLPESATQPSAVSPEATDEKRREKPVTSIETPGSRTDDNDMEQEEKSAAQQNGSSSTTRASPSTRKLAREFGIDLATVEGTGIGGRVTAKDVRQAATTNKVEDGRRRESAIDSDLVDNLSKKMTSQNVTFVDETPLQGPRATIARRMSESNRQAPHVTLNRTIDVESAFCAIDELDDEVGFTDFLVVAAGKALEAHPRFNAWFEDGVHRRISEVNVAVAVDTDRGLFTPVVREVLDRSILTVAADRRDLAASAQSGRLSSDDLDEGTFTISNLGPFGVESFDPIINPPQVAILGVGAAIDGKCTFSLSFDHRVVDGADAARFLDTLADNVEAPTGLLVEHTSGTTGSQTSAVETESAPSGTSSESHGSLEALASEVERSLVAALEGVATVYDWPTPTLQVSFSDDRTPTITARAPRDANPAAVRRAVYTACRESPYAGTIVGLRDPVVILEPESSSGRTQITN